MGNANYRISPRRIYNSASGQTQQFEFAANQITGWRNSQEDRYVCLPKFYENFSLFAVYDGHGGEEVVQYLERFLHLFILRELELTGDVELALYLSFINCDSSLRDVSAAEYDLIKNDLLKEFEVPNKAERRKVLFGSMNAAGTSGQSQEELRAAIANACIQELPSISFLTQAPVQESDESDDEYQPGDEDVDYFSEEMESSNGGNSPESDSESVEDVEILEERFGATSSNFKESAGISTRKDTAENIMDKTLNEDTGNTAEKIKEERKEHNSEEEEDLGKQIGKNCGSTATVLLINETKIFIAHVGDSRCVACIQGQAVDLSQDHKPSDKEEMKRIIDAGGSVSEEGRIENDIDMSRAFGDFRYKVTDDPHQILTAEPSIFSMNISPDLEFIILASDGIWNTMDSNDVVHYVQRRIKDSSLELQDLCGELFEELLPENLTSDGSGCDNMTMIIMKFTKTQEFSNKTVICCYEISEYNYPPVNKESNLNQQSNKKTGHTLNNNESNNSTTENSKDDSKRSELKFEEKDPTLTPVMEQKLNPPENCEKNSSQSDRNHCNTSFAKS